MSSETKSTVELENWFKKNENEFEGIVKFEEPLLRHTYFRIGGPARVFVSPRTVEDLKLLSEVIQETGTDFFLLGAGSNVLVSDRGFNGLVIKLRSLNQELFPIQSKSGETTEKEFFVRTGGSVPIPSFLHKIIENGWGGLEFLSGIPGTIGGAAIMNAGTHLGESKDALRAVEVFPLLTPSEDPESDFIRFEGNELKYSYRTNHFIPQGSIVWAVEWKVFRESSEKIKSAIDQNLQRRKESQPVDFPCCGSVFKNPRAHGMSAWQVIDKLGLRGHRSGEAQISEKHANFILNHGEAKASDVQALIELVKKKASADLGIELEEEVRYLGF